MERIAITLNEEQFYAFRELQRSGDIPGTWVDHVVLNPGEGADIVFKTVFNGGLAFWAGAKMIQRIAKKCIYQRNDQTPSQLATSLVSKFMYFAGDFDNKTRYNFAIFSAQQHILEVTTATLTPEELVYLMEVSSELDKKKKTENI